MIQNWQVYYVFFEEKKRSVVRVSIIQYISYGLLKLMMKHLCMKPSWIYYWPSERVQFVEKRIDSQYTFHFNLKWIDIWYMSYNLLKLNQICSFIRFCGFCWKKWKKFISDFTESKTKQIDGDIHNSPPPSQKTNQVCESIPFLNHYKLVTTLVMQKDGALISLHEILNTQSKGEQSAELEIWI